MAEDNIQEIIKNAKNMSLQDLGGALLSRSSKIRSQRERKVKRQDKVNKILAVLLGGQAIFQKVAQNRMKDLDGIAKRMQSGTKKQAAEFIKLATVLQDVDPSMLNDPNALEKYRKSLKENGDFSNAFNTAIYINFTEPHFSNLGETVKNQFLKGSSAGSRNHLEEVYGSQVAEYFFAPNTVGKQSRAQVFMQAGNELFSGDKGFEVDEDVISSFLNIDSSDLNRKITAKALQEVKAIGGELSWFNAPRLLVNSIFKKKGEGNKSRFSRILDGDINLQPPSLDKALNKIKLFDAMPNASEAIDILNGTTDWKERGKQRYIEIEDGNAQANGNFHQTFRRVLFDKDIQTLNSLDKGVLDALEKHMFSPEATNIDVTGKNELVSRWYGTVAMIQNDPKLKKEMEIYGNSADQIKDQALIYLLKGGGVLKDNNGRLLDDPSWFIEGKDPMELDNFEYNFKKIDAHLLPSFTINDDGNLQSTPSLNNQDNKTVTANSIATIGQLQKGGRADLTENMIEQIYNNPTNDSVIEQFKQIIIPKYPTAVDFNDAIQNQGYKNVNNTLSTPTPTSTSTTTTAVPPGYVLTKEPEAWEDPYSAAADIRDKGQLGSQVIPKALYDAGVRQVERQAEILLERHFKGSVNATDKQLQEAMLRLNLTSLEEAKNKYSMVE